MLPKRISLGNSVFISWNYATQLDTISLSKDNEAELKIKSRAAVKIIDRFILPPDGQRIVAHLRQSLHQSFK